MKTFIVYDLLMIFKYVLSMYKFFYLRNGFTVPVPPQIDERFNKTLNLLGVSNVIVNFLTYLIQILDSRK